MAVGTNIQHQDSAWLAHIIVHPNYRNRGLGKELAHALTDSLDKSRFKTVYLDATDMGYPVYLKLGFELESEYIHLDGELQDLYLNDPSMVIPFHEKYRTELLALDREVSAENRIDVLSNHLISSLLYISDGKLLGAYFPTLLDGFVLASDPVAGTELMKIRMRTKNTARFPEENISATNFLLEHGYKKMRTSRRMILGEKRDWKRDGIYGRVSGGLG